MVILKLNVLITKHYLGKILKYTSLIILVLQNAGLVLIMKYATTRPQDKFLKTVVVFSAEVIKLIASFIFLIFSNNSIMKTLKDLKYHFFIDWLDTIKVGIPAFIYTIQNFLLYVAVENLETGTYMVTYQIKILTTAAFTVLMLKRKLSIPQWISLVVLITGVALVQLVSSCLILILFKLSFQNIGQENGPKTINLNETENNTTISAKVADAKHGNPIVGLITVLVACVLSGFAGIYFEKILKGSNVSLWMRNTQLATLSIPIGAAFIAVSVGLVKLRSILHFI